MRVLIFIALIACTLAAKGKIAFEKKAPYAFKAFNAMFNYLQTTSPENQKMTRDHIITVLENEDSVLFTQLSTCNENLKVKVGKLIALNKSTSSSDAMKTKHFKLWLLQKLNSCSIKKITDDNLRIMGYEIVKQEAVARFANLQNAEDPEIQAAIEEYNQYIEELEQEGQSMIDYYTKLYDDNVSKELQADLAELGENLKNQWSEDGGVKDQLTQKALDKLNEQSPEVQELISWLWEQVDE